VSHESLRIGASTLLFVAWNAAAQDDRPYPISEEREPCAAYEPEKRPLFGDTHVHTAFSFDANAQDTRTRPRDAYRFARGEPIGIQPYDDDGKPMRQAQLDRPLDFVAVTDHAEFMGEMSLCNTPGTWEYWHPVCWAHRNVPNAGVILFGARGLILKERWQLGLCGDEGSNCQRAASRTWLETRAAAEEAYDRTSACRFSSFVGYEWTASVGTGQNLHRNVIFRNAQVPSLPASWIETPSARELWDRLEADCLQGIPGCDVLTIPHNSNLSGGLMFESSRVRDSQANQTPAPIRAQDALRRSRWEPLVEIMQHKGSSECDSRLEPWSTDEACGFEKLPYNQFGSKDEGAFVERQLSTPNDYVRWALQEGLRIQQRLGANPFRYGIIASTDSHISAPGLTAEKDHPGHGGAGMNAGSGLPEGLPDDLEFGPGGLAVVWAEENNRDAIFAAMLRRETYGTSGTRPVVRFFGGWDYPEGLCDDPNFVSEGYASGVPMGGELPARSGDGGPRFALWALRDPGSGKDAGSDLRRIQIIKGWIENDEHREQVVDVVTAPGEAGVDPATCEPWGRGQPKMCSVWQDPDFDPAQPAFYYARVLESPTCRWSQLLCNQRDVDCNDSASIGKGLEGCCSPEHRPVIQERAWTSPIWYTP
jgi:hypothetical protein